MVLQMFVGAQGKGGLWRGWWLEGMVNSFGWVTLVCCPCTRASVLWVWGVQPVAEPCQTGEVSPEFDHSHSLNCYQLLTEAACSALHGV